MWANKRFYLNIVILVQIVQRELGQPSIEDVTFSGNVATIRWDTQCSGFDEVTNITYGCSQTNFLDSDFDSVQHRINRTEPLRQKQLSLPITNEGEWRCVFKLQGVQFENCTTKDSICVLIEITSYTMLINGKK